VAADLAELEKGVEEDDLRLLDAARGDRFADALVHRCPNGFVEVLLAGIQLDEVDEFGFRWEFLGDLVLGAAEDERGDAAVEGELGLAGAVALDGAAELGVG
jgi:hypothetical protein